MKPQTIRIEVYHGIATVIDVPDDCIVEIYDRDEKKGFRTYRAQDEIITERMS